MGRLGCARVLEARVGIIMCSVEIRWELGAIGSWWLAMLVWIWERRDQVVIRLVEGRSGEGFMSHILLPVGT